ncbi:MAG TPA: CAP domain-containing protein [Syntrophomonadaceae bacterium]|nr:CAP domain-containing protein [Syntrophomonadaceae bacterium]
MQKLLTIALVVFFSALSPLTAAAADCNQQITYTRLGSADIDLADYFSRTTATSAPVVKIISNTSSSEYSKLISLLNGSTTVSKTRYYSPVVIKRIYQKPVVITPVPKTPVTPSTPPATPGNPPAVPSTPPVTPPVSDGGNGTGTGTVTSNFNAMQTEMLSYINNARSAAGVSSLSLDKSLCEGATLKSKDMAVNGYFSHTSPTYGSPFEMMKSLGITYRSAGENIAKNTSVIGAHNAFMNSSGHKANILNSSFKKVGLGFYQKGSYLYVTQWFTN